MGYKEDFSNADGWSAADVSTRLNTAAGTKLLTVFKAYGVDTIIRYYASSARSKTLTPEEAIFLSKEGFGIVPVFQDSSRSIDNFSNKAGTDNAKSAMTFAEGIGQPIGVGSTILFAVDADYTASQIDGPILDYFRAVARTIGDAFQIGAYGSGALLSRLLNEKLIHIPWISMSRAFLGTEQFFYGGKWAMRQVPPEIKDVASGIAYDRNVIGIARNDFGTFQVGADGAGSRVGSGGEDTTLGAALTAIKPTRIDRADWFVTTEGVRLRGAPDGAILREMTIAEPVVDLGPSTVEKWRRVSTASGEGVVFGKYLREPGRPEVEALIRATVDEWLRFAKGKGDEKADPYCTYVREMWAAIGEPYDGRSKYPNGDEVPWSAAFISWVVRRAGPAYVNFQFASSHSVFVNNAIKARVMGRGDKPFWGYRLTEERPEIGDIIQRNRDKNVYTFSFAENHAQYSSHSDIVVEVTPDVVRVMGGNVGDTVSIGTDLQEYSLDANGFLAPGQRVIALLKNRAGV